MDADQTSKDKRTDTPKTPPRKITLPEPLSDITQLSPWSETTSAGYREAILKFAIEEVEALGTTLWPDNEPQQLPRTLEQHDKSLKYGDDGFVSPFQTGLIEYVPEDIESSPIPIDNRESKLRLKRPRLI